MLIQFPETCIVLRKDGGVFALTSAKKAGILETLQYDQLTVFKRSKDVSEIEQGWKGVVEACGSAFGVIERDVFEGAFFQEFKKRVNGGVDVASVVAGVFAVKDEVELVS